MSPSEALYKNISFKMKVTIMDIFFSTQYINPGDEECLKQCATKAEHLYAAFFFFHSAVYEPGEPGSALLEHNSKIAHELFLSC